MKKPKPRYTTEQQILDKIEREKRRNFDYLKNVEALEEEVKTMNADAYRTGRVVTPFVVDRQREIRRLLRVCNNIVEKRLPKLKNKLSEFRTSQFPALDNGDPSIPVA